MSNKTRGNPKPISSTFTLDTLPPGTPKSRGTTIVIPESPKRFVRYCGGPGQRLMGGFPIHLLVKYRPGDKFRLTVLKLPKKGQPPPDPVWVLQQIYEVLYRDGDQLDPDKQWAVDTIEKVAELVHQLLPKPSKITKIR